TFHRTTPAAFLGSLSSGVTAIAAGARHNLAVKNGNVYAWGTNTLGVLGDPTVSGSSPTLIDPTDLTGIGAVAAGIDSSYALSSDGSLWVWGSNQFGELGLGGGQSYYTTPQHLLPPAGYFYTSIDADPTYSSNVFFHSITVVATLAAVPEPPSVVLI